MNEKNRAFAFICNRTANRALPEKSGPWTFYQGGYTGATLEEAMRKAETYAMQVRGAGSANAGYDYKTFGGMITHEVETPEPTITVLPINRMNKSDATGY